MDEKQRALQLKQIAEMQGQIKAGAKVRDLWEKRKKAASAFIDVSVFKAGLGPALDQYRAMLKGGYDVMAMHGKADGKTLKPVEAAKAKLDKAVKAYLDLAVAQKARPSDKLSGKIDAPTQKKVWAQVEKDLRELKSVTDRWWKNLEKTVEQQRKEMQGEYGPRTTPLHPARSRVDDL